MSIYGKVTAAAGAIVLNVVAVLVLTQSAGAATLAGNASVQGSQTYTAFAGSDHETAHKDCSGGIRARAIIAVVLSLIV